MFEGITEDEKIKLLMAAPDMSESDQDALIEAVEQLMLRAFRDGVNAGRG